MDSLGFGGNELAQDSTCSLCLRSFDFCFCANPLIEPVQEGYTTSYSGTVEGTTNYIGTGYGPNDSGGTQSYADNTQHFPCSNTLASWDSADMLQQSYDSSLQSPTHQHDHYPLPEDLDRLMEFAHPDRGLSMESEVEPWTPYRPPQYHTARTLDGYDSGSTVHPSGAAPNLGVPHIQVHGAGPEIATAETVSNQFFTIPTRPSTAGTSIWSTESSSGDMPMLHCVDPQDHSGLPLPTSPIRGRSLSVGSTNGKELVKCSQCSKCLQKKSLSKHIKNHAEKKTTKKRNYKCELCDMAFHWPKDLRRHIVKHTRERVWKCNEVGCPYLETGFQREDHLNRHLNTVHSDSASSLATSQSYTDAYNSAYDDSPYD